jgi:hypothetical protein
MLGFEQGFFLSSYYGSPSVDQTIIIYGRMSSHDAGEGTCEFRCAVRGRELGGYVERGNFD